MEKQQRSLSRPRSRALQVWQNLLTENWHADDKKDKTEIKKKEINDMKAD